MVHGPDLNGLAKGRRRVVYTSRPRLLYRHFVIEVKTKEFDMPKKQSSPKVSTLASKVLSGQKKPTMQGPPSRQRWSPSSL